MASQSEESVTEGTTAPESVIPAMYDEHNLLTRKRLGDIDLYFPPLKFGHDFTPASAAAGVPPRHPFVVRVRGRAFRPGYYLTLAAYLSPLILLLVNMYVFGNDCLPYLDPIQSPCGTNIVWNAILLASGLTLLPFALLNFGACLKRLLEKTWLHFSRDEIVVVETVVRESIDIFHRDLGVTVFAKNDIANVSFARETGGDYVYELFPRIGWRPVSEYAMWKMTITTKTWQAQKAVNVVSAVPSYCAVHLGDISAESVVTLARLWRCSLSADTPVTVEGTADRQKR